ncbi:MAG: hypothetical protein FD147_355 [Chloroflexi bacterium]|nr:MAG: hypothetical protein FD147_355 [Chloroflexota bacterium]MBA4375215.1 hypothetical protein [Anaerolinea sp.]
MRLDQPGFSKIFQINAIILFSMMILLTSCGRANLDAIAQTTLSVDSTLFPQATLTVTSTENPATATATLLSPQQQQNNGSGAGLIVFAMGDGEYKHLFAYHPSYLPITRLTSEAWDDDSPAISPDGNKIVFTSNRFGTWDIFLLDLPSNTLTQLTKTNDFEGSPYFSPDGQYITYDLYRGNRFNILIQSVSDPTEAPIQLTDGTSNNFNPAWSPSAPEIAFVTDRSGRNEIWLARLDDPENRFSKIIASADADYSDPAWSPDGVTLAWSRCKTVCEIEVVQPLDLEPSPISLGTGNTPVWLPDGSGVLATLKLPNQNEFIAYAVSDRHLLLPPIPLPGVVSAYDWKAGQVSTNIQIYLSSTQISQPASLWAEKRSIASSGTGRRGLVLLKDVEAPQPYLSDAALESFIQLRSITSKKTGWDLLAILENASLSLTAPPLPGIIQNWLYSGRAIALNLAPFEAGWMSISREEFFGETFWRVWVKCQKQDGTCGVPLTNPAWDFNSRYSGDLIAFEEGGKTASIPAGYWIDFTELAYRFGWERLSSQSNWRSYFPGILFNTFVFRQGLSWDEALGELYPSEAVDLLIENQK